MDKETGRKSVGEKLRVWHCFNCLYEFGEVTLTTSAKAPDDCRRCGGGPLVHEHAHTGLARVQVQAHLLREVRYLRAALAQVSNELYVALESMPPKHELPNIVATMGLGPLEDLSSELDALVRRGVFPDHKRLNTGYYFPSQYTESGALKSKAIDLTVGEAQAAHKLFSDL